MLAHAGVGFSGSILYSPSTAVSGHWFLHKRSTAVGIVVCGSGLAGVIYPIMIKNLIELLSEFSRRMAGIDDGTELTGNRFP